MKKKSFVQPLVLSVAYGVLCYALWNSKYLNWRYRFIFFFASLALLMLLLIVTKRSVFRLSGAVLILCVASLLIYTQHTLGSIMTPQETDVLTYQLFSLKDTGSIASSTIYGELGQAHTRDEYIIAAYESNKITNPEIKYFNSMSELVLSLYDGTVDAIWIDNRFFSEIALLFPDFGQRTIVSARYEVKIERDDITKPVNILKDSYVVYVSGIDVYGSTNTRSRSDLNLLVAINPRTQSVLTISIPRDTYVPLACRDEAMDKLTHSALYGVSCSVATLEKMFDVDINYYVRVNFTSLETVVDAIGGVDVLSEYDFDTDSGFHFDKGVNAVDGKAAVAFARERIHIPYGDVSRGIHHQALIEAIFRKMLDPTMIQGLPALVPSLMNVIDTNFGYDNFTHFVSHEIDNAKAWDFTKLSLDGTGDMQYTYSQGDTYKYYVYWPNEESLHSIINEIKVVSAMEASENE